MGSKTTIEWTDATWNPIRGCTKVSRGCDNCYAMGVAYRFSGRNQPYEGLARTVNGRPAWTNLVREAPDHTEDPLRWLRPRRIFVNSMSDLFHEQLSDAAIGRIFAVMGAAPWHTFQVLTKRPARMATLLSNPDFVRFVERGILVAATGHHHAIAVYKRGLGGPTMPFPHVWLGVSVEDQESADERIPHLMRTPAAIRFLSCEPLLGPVDLSAWIWATRHDTDGETGEETSDLEPTGALDWVIVGGESGPRARPMHPNWARELQVDCTAAQVAFFFKQWGRFTPWNQLPAHDPRLSRMISLMPDGRYEDAVVPLDGSQAWPGRALMVPVGKHASGRLLDGHEWHEVPEGTP